jgi:hypothetical protein
MIETAGRAFDLRGCYERTDVVMIVFDIVEESYGWAVRRDNCMMMPATCRAAAVAAAEQMVRALSNCGHPAELHFKVAIAAT